MSSAKRIVARLTERYATNKVVARFMLAMEHPSEEARRDYLKDHPGADPRNHTVDKSKGDGGGAKKGPSPAAGVSSQMSSAIKKIDNFDAGGSAKELGKYGDELAAVGRKLEKQLEKLDGKVDPKKLNRALEHVQGLSSSKDKLVEMAGSFTKVDKYLADIQGELRDAMKLLG
jgi:hypothetical protein